MRFVISNYSIFGTISGMYGLGSLSLQVNVVSLWKRRGKNRYCPAASCESICCCIVKQICPTVQALILACRRLGRRVFCVWCSFIHFCVRAALCILLTLHVCSILRCLHVIVLNKIKGLAFVVEKCFTVRDWSICNTTLYLCELST